MDCKGVTSSRKRKKYSKRSYLTVEKKSKRYRLNRSIASANGTDSAASSTEYNLSSGDETSTPSIPGHLTESKSQELNSQRIETSILHKNLILRKTSSTRNKACQIKPSVKTSHVQACVTLKTKSIHAIPIRNVTSSSTQTNSSECRKKLSRGDKLMKRLHKQSNFSLFAQKLHENEQTDKFVKCISSLSNGKLAFTNMAWKSFLDMGALISCTSTTAMEYDKEWLEFCQVLYHMFGAGVINALRGRGHFSQVSSEKTKKGKYNPVSGEFNFPIPSIPTLKKLDIGFPSDIPVGFVDQSLILAQRKAKEGSQFVLSFDGKLIAPGCKGDSTGDSNLWGIEGPPNLTTAVKILNNTLDTARNINVEMDKTSSLEHFYNCRELVNVSSRRIKKLRSKITSCFYSRKKLVEKCGDNAELQYKNKRKMSSLNQTTAECESVIRRLLEINLKTTSIMAFLNNNGDVHIGNMPRHINLSERGNNFQLLPPDIVSNCIDLNDSQNMQFIKQRSDKWFELRKQFRVTGSTLNTALGLDTLQKQKDHHYIHVRGRKPPPIPPELQKKFDYGSKNEVNAIATLISTVVPAYLPACYAFYEVGPTFVDSDDRPNLLEVSSDGILQCSFGHECPNYQIHGDRKILVEIKSPVPQENVAETIFYGVPSRYMPQVQSQLKAYICKELWLVCSTSISASVIVVHFDQTLWESIWSVLLDLYSADKPKIPTRLHPAVKQLRIDINNSKDTHTSFLCEIPTVTGEFGSVTIPADFSSPYAPAPGRNNILKTNEMITEENLQLSVDAKCAFKQCHQVLRDPGRELLVFMLTDKDRKQSHNVPYSYPVAYALKGASMTNSHLKYLVDIVRNRLHEMQIPVLCEAYDGQWHKFITEGTESNPLTNLHGRENWNRFSSMSKEKCIENIASLSVVKKSTQDLIKACNVKKNEKILIQEIRIEKGRNNELFLSSQKGQMQYVHSIHPISRPDLYKKQEIDDLFAEPLNRNDVVIAQSKYIRCNDGYKRKREVKYKYTSIFINARTEQEEKSKRKGRIFGLQENEETILDVLLQNNSIQDVDDDDLNTERVEGRIQQVEKPTLEEYLRSDKCSLLENIRNELRNANPAKWEGKTCDDLFPGLLNVGQTLLTETTVKELNIICLEMRCVTGRNWSSSNMVKAEIVNVIVKAFGGEAFVEVDRRKKKIFNPETLATNCINYIKSIDYPQEHIQIPLATLRQIENRNAWIQNATVPLTSFVPASTTSDSQEHRVIKFFSYPAYATTRDQIEFRTFDFTHILTNIRTQILTRGLEYCKKEHFEHLCTHKPGILSLALVFEKTDQQNAFTAMRMFNYDVERYMKEQGFNETAEFIKLVRNWHDACNRRGITADVRVAWLTDMHEFLTRNINFDAVPFQYPGRYIKGLTWQTYEALLQVISTRIQLYQFAAQRTYNARAVSTLSNESFFSDLVRYDKESHGYPKGTNISRVFGRVVLINHFKHKRDKNYYLAATIKSKYEVKLAEASQSRLIRETAYHFSGMFRDHFFDFPNQLKSQRVRRDDITTGLAALRTSGGVRRWHKTIEADILPEIRGGNKTKGFTLKKNVY